MLQAGKGITDADGKKLVLINDIRFRGKRQINWDDVKQYLEGYVGDYYEIAENVEHIFIGSELPEEYTENPAFEENRKEKHNKNAKYGWYRYDVRFSLPVYEENTLVRYNIFHARLLINHAVQAVIIEDTVVDTLRGGALFIDFLIGIRAAGDIGVKADISIRPGLDDSPIFGVRAAVPAFGAVFPPIRAAPHEVTAGSVITIGLHAQLFLA